MAPRLDTRALLLPFLLFAVAACTPSPDERGRGAGSGKADDFGLECPDNVTLNSGAGSARRCINEDNGQFVASACCASVCEGADWVAQSGGERCRWVDGIGLPGAALGQFAPRMCCELNDQLACASGSLVAGSCQSADGEPLEPVCCQSEPISCHPMLASSMRECVDAVVADFASDSESLPVDALQALMFCAEEGDLQGAMLDSLCQFAPDVFCDLDFETFSLEYVAACRDELLPQYSCALGLRFGDLFDNPRVVVADTRFVHLSDAQNFSSTEKAQILKAVEQSAAGQVSNLAEAFDVMDGNELRVVRFWEGSNGKAMHAFEFGAGDNSFGAIFDDASGALVARIVDGDFYTAASQATLGCEVQAGPRWQTCSENADCASGLTCMGRIDEHPAQQSLGKCVKSDLGQGVPQNGADCQSLDDCPLDEGLLCSGLSIFDSGFCRPAWMFASFADKASSLISTGTNERDLYVYGLATVPEDARIRLELSHPDVSKLDITVIPAMRDQGSLATVFLGAKDATPGQTHLSIDANLMHPGDEDLNGKWTLVIKDTSSSSVAAGVLHSFSIEFSSRFD